MSANGDNQLPGADPLRSAERKVGAAVTALDEPPVGVAAPPTGRSALHEHAEESVGMVSN
jgi:hypothetical protein